MPLPVYNVYISKCIFLYLLRSRYRYIHKLLYYMFVIGKHERTLKYVYETLKSKQNDETGRIIINHYHRYMNWTWIHFSVEIVVAVVVNIVKFKSKFSCALYRCRKMQNDINHFSVTRKIVLKRIQVYGWWWSRMLFPLTFCRFLFKSIIRLLLFCLVNAKNGDEKTQQQQQLYRQLWRKCCPYREETEK